MEEEKKEEGAAPPSQPPRGRKPVVIYIVVLFMAAFLLMALSLFMHQRSNSEALGQLQSDLSAMQEVQATQEKIIQLQEELSKTQGELEDLQDAQQAQTQLLQQREKALSAMLNLYALERCYQAGDYDTCRTILAGMEENGQDDALDQDLLGEDAPSHLFLPEGMTDPAQRYQQLKTAVEAQTPQEE